MKRDPSNSMTTDCPKCHGMGEVECQLSQNCGDCLDHNDCPYEVDRMRDCPHCGGDGWIYCTDKERP